MSTTSETATITIPHLQAMATRGEKIAMVTAYDYASGRIADSAGIDIILVGDSAAMTMLGYSTTIPITVDDLLVFARAVTRASSHAFVIADMPFGSYHASEDEAIHNALRFMKEAQVDAVKIEGGSTVAPLVRRFVDAGIPVMGHIGLTPQHAAALGGFRLQGSTAPAVESLLRDAHALEEAGAFALVIEMVPAIVAGAITRAVRIPTIGIGAGNDCSGQVLVWHDMFNLYHGRTPRFVRRYGDAAEVFTTGLATYIDDVRAGRFPAAEHTYDVAATEREAIEDVIRRYIAVER